MPKHCFLKSYFDPPTLKAEQLPLIWTMWINVFHSSEVATEESGWDGLVSWSVKSDVAVWFCQLVESSEVASSGLDLQKNWSQHFVTNLPGLESSGNRTKLEIVASSLEHVFLFSERWWVRRVATAYWLRLKAVKITHYKSTKSTIIERWTCWNTFEMLHRDIDLSHFCPTSQLKDAWNVCRFSKVQLVEQLQSIHFCSSIEGRIWMAWKLKTTDLSIEFKICHETSKDHVLFLEFVQLIVLSFERRRRLRGDVFSGDSTRHQETPRKRGAKMSREDRVK